MAKGNKNSGKVPNLRFPEFEGAWEETTLGKCSCEIDYGMNAAAMKFDGENRYIRITDIDESSSMYKSDAPVSPNAELSDKYLLQQGDILFARTGASTGRTYLYNDSDGKLYFAGFLIRARIKKHCNTSFIFTQTQTLMYDKWVKLMSMRSGQPGINSQEYASFKFKIPNKREQDKISSFLLLIDSRIQTQNKIIEGLKLLKKMLIKKIFNQQLRFNEGHNTFPDWEEKKMKELFSFKITNSFSREQLNHKNGKVKNIHYGDIHTKFPTLFDIEQEEVPYINPDINIAKINEENYCAIGDMIFADASEDSIDVGKSIEIVNLNNQKLLAGLHTILARPISGNFSVGFCGYLFKSPRIRTQIQKESQGSKVLSISAVRLSNIFLSIPCVEEQIKITNFLSSIDSKIDIEAKFLQRLKEQKKFLLQNLFA